MDIRWACLVLAVTLARCEESADDDFDDDSSLSLEESRGVRPRAYPTPPPGNYPSPASYNSLTPGGFRPSPAAPAPAPLSLLANYPRPPNPSTTHGEGVPAVARAPHRKAPPQEKENSAESEEREEPDRLQLLLQQTRFQCHGRPGGYYADEDLNCEVFHYCQDNVRHSWICPEGFVFHQVHLICMPPSNDHICEKSAKYTFVNEYLYRPVNEEEVQRRPNVSLRYSDRYYPSEVFHDDRYEDEDEGEDGQHPAQRPQPQQRPQQVQQVVFRSAAEVDIPLSQRRPAPQHY